MRFMRILVAIIVLAVISVGWAEAQDKETKDKLEKAIREGSAAICREYGDRLWIEESEKCVSLYEIAYRSGEWSTAWGREEE